MIDLKKFNFSGKGWLFLTFQSQTTVNHILDNWSTDVFGNDATAHRYDPNFKPTPTKFFAILKHCPKSIPSHELQNNLKLKFDSIESVERFTTNNGNILQTLKLTFTTKSDRDQLLNSGGFPINNIFYPATPYMHRKSPLFCQKCCAYGHYQKICFKPKICLNCAGKHHETDCTANAKKCAVCSGNHAANDYHNCPTYLNHIVSLNSDMCNPDFLSRLSQTSSL
jgi:hypothetical protein